ncbi:MAG: trypsin-like peptidase domain-containing protein [Candidatus Woykebacteria bacterium]
MKIMLKKYKNQVFIIGGLVAVFLLAVIVGTAIGVSYPNWSKNLSFLPDFLKPASGVEEVTQNGEKVIRTVEESAVIDVADKASPAVVSIVASQATLDPAQGVQTDQQGIGTGFIVRKDGVILTASHVVDDDSISYKVVTRDEKQFDVIQIDKDPSVDFAILKIKAGGLPILKLADSDSVRVGQKVVAIGNALGRFSNTVTVGVVSGVGRGVAASNASGISQGTLENVIQTDAALNPGNSGGPLLDLSANVIGINFATTVGAENIGFVIPANSVEPVLQQYLAEGRIIRPFLGISYVIVDETTSVLQGIPQGVFVQRVLAGTPAAKAGLEAGDVITKFGGQKLDENQTLSRVIGKFKVGQTIELEVNRDGKTVKLKTTLTEAP